MIKQAIRILAFFLLTYQGIAQSWFPQGAQWYTGHAVNFCTGYHYLEVNGDTLIDGLTYQKIERNTACYSGQTQQQNFSTATTVFVRSDQDVVWIYVPHQNMADTLYHMSAVPGDEWVLADMPMSIFPPEQRCTVTDTFTTIIQGVSLRGLEVLFTLEDNLGTLYTEQDTILERIGTLGWMLLPIDRLYSSLGVVSGGPICSYTDGQLAIGDSMLCSELITNISPLHATERALALYPNPGSEVVNIALPFAMHHGVFQVFDQQGQLVHKEVLHQNATGIHHFNTEVLSQGSYTCIMLTDKGKKWIGKWVRE